MGYAILARNRCPGFVIYKSSCIICPPGTYSFNNNICLTCKKGYFNPLPGASSIMQCYPCPEGSFNDKKGCKECKVCTVGYFCYAGRINPEALKINTQIIKQSLTNINAEKTHQYSDYNVIYIGLSITIILFLAFLLMGKQKL